MAPAMRDSIKRNVGALVRAFARRANLATDEELAHTKRLLDESLQRIAQLEQRHAAGSGKPTKQPTEHGDAG